MLQTTSVYTTIIVIVGCAIILFFVIFFYLLIIQLHRRRIIHQKEMVDLIVEHEKTLLLSQLEIQEQTFRNISQEIHDNITQVLSLAKLNLNTILDESYSEKLNLTEELLTKAITDLRDLAKSLNTEKIADVGLIEAVKNEMVVIEKVAHIKANLSIDEWDDFLSREHVIIVYRMLQEILNNILKHAKASNINIHFNSTTNKMHIRIDDDGVGFDITSLQQTQTGIGLKSIQQRCDLVNATFNINSIPGAGTRVDIYIVKP
jgi:signal transduction histidine kinase